MLHQLRREIVRLAPYGVLVLFAITLVFVRMAKSGTPAYRFLLWNFVLAAVPVVLSSLVRIANERRVGRGVLLSVLAVWLLFFPNAPYILTDLLHLHDLPPVPLWYDLVLLLTAAGTGLALGYRSLLDVEAVTASWWGTRTATVASIAVLFLSAFGIYLGRFLRLNSWDVLANQSRLLVEVADRFIDPSSHPRTWSFTLLFGVLLSLGYVAVRWRAPSVARTYDVGPQEINAPL